MSTPSDDTLTRGAIALILGKPTPASCFKPRDWTTLILGALDRVENLSIYPQFTRLGNADPNRPVLTLERETRWMKGCDEVRGKPEARAKILEKAELPPNITLDTSVVSLFSMAHPANQERFGRGDMLLTTEGCLLHVAYNTSGYGEKEIVHGCMVSIGSAHFLAESFRLREKAGYGMSILNGLYALAGDTEKYFLERAAESRGDMWRIDGIVDRIQN